MGLIENRLAPLTETRAVNGLVNYAGYPLVVVFAAVPLLEELVKEVRVSLSLSVGLIAGIDLGDQGIVLGVFS